MIICPQCKTENPNGSVLCKKCGTVFSNQPTPPAWSRENINQTQPHPVDKENGSGFTERPEGAIFGGRFVFDSLRYKDAEQIRYTVVERSLPMQPRLRICPNPECGAVHVPAGEEVEQLCTQCGAPLQDATPLFLLQEARQPIFGASVDVAGKPGGLAHPNVRAPFAYFMEQIGGETRFCLVSPNFSTFPDHLEPAQVLLWGIRLARGLDYLHKNQLSFGGQVTDHCFGLDGIHPVWVDFSNCNVPPDMLSQAQSADVRALAGVIYAWLTGKSRFSFEPRLPTAINHLFQEALDGTGYTTGEAFALAIETAQNESKLRGSGVDHRLGRRTDVGQERTLNEDSLLTVEVSRVLQSIHQPLGVFAVADGMGGHSAGEIASATIVNTISRNVLKLDPLQPMSTEMKEKWIREVVEAANKAVFDLRKSAGTDMGSTLVIALLEGAQATLAHAGDSRIYLINAQEIRQLTTDHSLVERLVDTGQITRSEARNHPQRNVVYRTIGDKLNLEIEVSTHHLAPGDRLLLCTDGLNSMLEDRSIQKIVLESTCPQEACDRLITAANAAGGEDNITAVVIEIVAA